MRDDRSKYRSLGLVCICLACYLYSGFAQPQQLAFKRSEHHDATALQFSYQWREASGVTRSLSFSVNKDNFLEPLKRFRNYNLKRANRELYKRLTRYVKLQNYRGVSVSLSPRQQHLTITVRSVSDPNRQQHYNQQGQRVKAYYLQQWQDYLDTQHYRYLQLPSGEQGIIPNAVAIARSQEQLFSPLIDAIGQTLKDNSRRSYTTYIAQFIQAIPYNALNQNIDSRGDGFMPPNHVVYYNQGDCDSKASLMAALIRPIIPSAKLAIVYLPGHALFAISMAAQANDATINHDGSELVLTEVAGPAMMPVGQLSAQSQFYLNSGQYTVVPIN